MRDSVAVRNPLQAPFLVLWLAAAAAGAQEPAQVPTGLDLPGLVGLTLPEALQRLGPPGEMFAARGEEGWQDDVVFYYPSHLYLFWYQNRVWQARVDSRYSGGFLAKGAASAGTPAGGAEAGTQAALSMGWSREQVLSVLGPPMREIDGSLVYHLEDRGYPVRLRLYFREGQLADAYCFRGDL